MKNSRSYSTYYGNDEKYRVNEFKDISIEISPLDKMRFKQFIKEEGKYYNSIIDVVAPYMRTSKEWLLSILEGRRDVFEKISDGSLSFDSVKMSERESFVFRSAKSSANIIPAMKRNIISEMISHYIRIINDMTTNTGTSGDIVYSKPIELLHHIDLNNKNSIQIQKNLLKMENDGNGNTKIWLPYSSSFITVPNTDLIKNKNWNILFIKFNYDRKNNERWYISTRKTNSKYILKQSTVTSKK